jgi:hypothetical protein
MKVSLESMRMFVVFMSGCRGLNATFTGFDIRFFPIMRMLVRVPMVMEQE